MSIMEIHYGTLDNAADSHRKIRDTLSEIEGDRASATLPSGCLGTILPSEDIVSGFQEATQATQEALAAAMDVCSSAAERIELFKQLVSETDQHVAESFTALGGGA